MSRPGKMLSLNPRVNVFRYGSDWETAGCGSRVAIGLFRYRDRPTDQTQWSITEVEVMRSSPSEGIFSLAINDSRIIAVGGDYQVLDKGDANIP